MTEQKIEDVINRVLIGKTKNNALEFTKYLRANEMIFERGKGYWEDKYYWGIKYNNEFICFILISNEEKINPESWTIWSDDSGSNIFGDSSMDEKIKNILWKHVVICENINKCFDGCKKSHKTILGKEFDNVCGTFIKFENPNTETMNYMKKMVEIRKQDILGNI